ncbi:hypothetical protein BXZ70DRAFT_904366 [Cristinia sonorae]|uniref:Uncharacterized protein n=1 Tax=Cristinia sonorae TaxID=1940300 RepID=A0A8K0XTC2_9AGAR|nr:hypothetical protein BXZ70DRAFT_904366 [Cristinia sonorae]
MRRQVEGISEALSVDCNSKQQGGDGNGLLSLWEKLWRNINRFRRFLVRPPAGQLVANCTPTELYNLGGREASQKLRPSREEELSAAVKETVSGHFQDTYPYTWPSSAVERFTSTKATQQEKDKNRATRLSDQRAISWHHTISDCEHMGNVKTVDGDRSTSPVQTAQEEAKAIVWMSMKTFEFSGNSGTSDTSGTRCLVIWTGVFDNMLLQSSTSRGRDCGRSSSGILSKSGQPTAARKPRSLGHGVPEGMLTERLGARTFQDDVANRVFNGNKGMIGKGWDPQPNTRLFNAESFHPSAVQ